MCHVAKGNRERKPVNYSLITWSFRMRHSFSANGRFSIVRAYKILSIISLGAFLPRIDFGVVNEATVCNCALLLPDINSSGDLLALPSHIRSLL